MKSENNALFPKEEKLCLKPSLILTFPVVVGGLRFVFLETILIILKPVVTLVSPGNDGNLLNASESRVQMLWQYVFSREEFVLKRYFTGQLFKCVRVCVFKRVYALDTLQNLSTYKLLSTLDYLINTKCISPTLFWMRVTLSHTVPIVCVYCLKNPIMMHINSFLKTYSKFLLPSRKPLIGIAFLNPLSCARTKIRSF